MVAFISTDKWGTKQMENFRWGFKYRKVRRRFWKPGSDWTEHILYSVYFWLLFWYFENNIVGEHLNNYSNIYPMWNLGWSVYYRKKISIYASFYSQKQKQLQTSGQVSAKTSKIFQWIHSHKSFTSIIFNFWANFSFVGQIIDAIFNFRCQEFSKLRPGPTIQYRVHYWIEKWHKTHELSVPSSEYVIFKNLERIHDPQYPSRNPSYETDQHEKRCSYA